MRLAHTHNHILVPALLVVFATWATASGGAAVGPQREVSVGPEPTATLYYFHRTFRCESCLTMEAYIDESLRTHFADALQEGRLLWLPINIEEPENTHFQEDFSIEFNSAVLVSHAGTAATSWRNLEKVWDLVEMKNEFLSYIRQEVEPVLAGHVEDPDGEAPE